MRKRRVMISILQNNISKWSVQKGESALLITSPFSNTSTLSKKLSVENNAKLIQIYTLMNFLRLNKYHFIEARGMNIIELEDRLLSDPNFKLTGEMDSFNEKDSLLSCINFLKEKRTDIYDDLKNNPFGERHYTIKLSEYDKYFYDSNVFNEYIDYLLEKYRHGNELVIIDGAGLLKKLSEDEELLNNAPIIIVDSDKFRAYFNAIRGMRNQMKMYHPEISSIKAYCSILWKCFKQRKEANEKMDRGKLYQSYIKNSTNLYDDNNPNLITNLKNSIDYNILV